MSKDWFRNSEWSPEIEAGFFEKLRRARQKAQYLRIQAGTLASSHPKVALKLLDEYFKLGDRFDHAQAYVDQATAYLALGNLEQAIQAYEAALAREEVFPNLKTQAALDLPFLIASSGIERLYNRGLQLLDFIRPDLMFPVDHFKWHAAMAFIASAQGKGAEANLNACEALRWTRKDHSGFRYHPGAGLVGDAYQTTESRLEVLCNAK